MLQEKMNQAETKMTKMLTDKEIAESKCVKLLHDTEDICMIAKRIDAYRKPDPGISWKKREKSYLSKIKFSGVKDGTWDFKRKVIGKFVTWLIKNGGRPTTQRVKRYLTERPVMKRPLMRGSYDRMRDVIIAFCNEYAENHERIMPIRALGHKKEKDAFAMPEEVLSKVSEHMDERVIIFGEKAEKLET